MKNNNQYSAAIKSSKNSQQVSVVLNSECSAAISSSQNDQKISETCRRTQLCSAVFSRAQQCSAQKWSAVFIKTLVKMLIKCSAALNSSMQWSMVPENAQQVTAVLSIFLKCLQCSKYLIRSQQCLPSLKNAFKLSVALKNAKQVSKMLSRSQ